MKNHIVLKLGHRRDNPRNSEGAFVTLKNGRILFIYTHYYGNSWDDEATAHLCSRISADGGRTWSKRDKLVLENEGGCNVMSVSLLRLLDGRIAMFYLRKNNIADCRAYLRISEDEGQSWSEPTLCIPAPGYFCVNNDRVIQLSGGRLVMPACLHRNRLPADAPRENYYSALDFHGIATFFLSDDAGRTWREASDWWALPIRSGSGMQEPGVVELRDGRLYAYARTDVGCQYELYSEDRGETWTAPRPSAFISPCSPLCIKRLPATGDLLAIWNDRSGRLTHSLPHGNTFKPKSWGRTPLATAISRDDGLTWKHHRLLETAPDHGFCYTAIHPTDDAVLLAYCCGGGAKSVVLQDLCIRWMETDWFYQ